MAPIWPRASDTRPSSTLYVAVTAFLTVYHETRICGRRLGTVWTILVQTHHPVVAWQRKHTF